MNWEAIGVVAEVISATAVVISLIYLALQIRLQGRQAAADNLQSNVDRWIGALTTAMRSEEDADFLRHALRDYSTLSPPQKARLHTFMLDLVSPYQAMHAKHESGLLDARLWGTIRKAMAAWITCPGMLGLWEEAKFAYPPYLVADIDRAIEEFEGEPFTETAPYLRLDAPDGVVRG
jgi:hypothetical protein